MRRCHSAGDTRRQIAPTTRTKWHLGAVGSATPVETQGKWRFGWTRQVDPGRACCFVPRGVEGSSPLTLCGTSWSLHWRT